ncbi:hypothetical protein C2U51_14875 [Enterobacteriaceae bacterium ENNIH1]|nr:hypothetical protein C2U51_14875 [Enterobacteriaceae bacterium ENNIH1]
MTGVRMNYLLLELCRDLEKISLKKQKKTRVLFFGRDSFSDNSKYLYLFMLEKYKELDIRWCTTNSSLAEEMTGQGLPCYNLTSNVRETLDFLLESAIAIFCVNPYDSVSQNHAMLASLRGALTFQMWHGIGPKQADLALTSLKDISNVHVTKSLIGAIFPEYYISSSSYIDGRWQDFFGAKNIIRANYPRNELLLREPKPLELLGAELDDSVHKALYQTQSKKVLIAPTWEQDTGLNNVNLLSSIVVFCQQNNIIMFIKNHPFIKEEDLSNGQIHNLYKIPSGVDIYPHLREFDALITDYSSIIYDYILTGKPVATVDASQGDDFDYSLIPGNDDYRYKLNEESVSETLNEMFFNDSKANAREVLANTLFEADCSSACDDIAKKILAIHAMKNENKLTIY